MSWQEYVDSSMVGSGHVDKAAIWSVAGDSAWATSANFSITPAEVQKLIPALNEKPEKLFEEGLYLAGERYVLTTANESVLYARKGREGLIIVKTTQAILIAHYGDGMIAGNAATTVEKLADYLKGVGY